MYTGELISIGVALSWTITALCFEYAGKRISPILLNVIRLSMALVMLMLTLYISSGVIYPKGASSQAWLWLGISGLIGYVLGDYCLFSSYRIIGSRFGQLFMTLSPIFAAFASWFILGERLSLNAIAGIFVTMTGIAISILSRQRGKHEKLHLNLPLKGVLFGVGAGFGQGVGLVFSKLGMQYFPTDSFSDFILPFASTEIRCIVGLTGFVIIMLLSGQGPRLKTCLKEGRAMAAATSGTVFGPFLGVSFSLMALNYTEAGIASTLMSLTPIMILLPYRIIYKQKISLHEIVGAFISVIGVSLFFI